MSTKSNHNNLLEEAYNRALTLEKAGSFEDAAKAYREVLEIDPQDCGGAQIRLAAMNKGETPLKAPSAYITTLFDQHALAFETILVSTLGYDIPEKISKKIQEITPHSFNRTLDLGCGTGLSGKNLLNQCNHITGVDLSEQMIEKAHEKNCYDELFVAEIVNFLTNSNLAKWDLIIATDVLPYFGTLDELFEAVEINSNDEGIFAFSSELLIDSEHGATEYKVNTSCRFVHSESYILKTLSYHGFTCLDIQPTIVREEEGESVQGQIIIARKLR